MIFWTRNYERSLALGWLLAFGLDSVWLALVVDIMSCCLFCVSYLLIIVHLFMCTVPCFVCHVSCIVLFVSGVGFLVLCVSCCVYYDVVGFVHRCLFLAASSSLFFYCCLVSCILFFVSCGAFCVLLLFVVCLVCSCAMFLVCVYCL